MTRSNQSAVLRIRINNTRLNFISLALCDLSSKVIPNYYRSINLLAVVMLTLNKKRKGKAGKRGELLSLFIYDAVIFFLKEMSQTSETLRLKSLHAYSALNEVTFHILGLNSETVNFRCCCTVRLL